MESDPVLCETLRNTTTPAIRPKVENRPIGVEIQIGLFYSINVLLGLFLVAFAVLKYIHPSRKKLARIRHRNFILVILTHLGASFTTLTGSWFQAHPLATGLPCWTYLTAYFLQVPCLAFPLVIRLLAFYRAEQWTAAVVSTQQQNENDDLTSVANSEQTHTSTSINAMQLAKAFLRALLCRTRIGTSASVIKDVEAITTVEQGRKEQIRMLRFLKSKKGSYLTSAIIFFPYLLTVAISLATHQFVQNGCWGCTPQKTEEIVLIIESVVALLLLFISYRLNMYNNDPFGIVQEIRMVIWLGGAPAVLFLILQTTLKAQIQGDFQFTMLIEISLFIFCFVQSGLQCILALVELSREHRTAEEVMYSLKEFEENFVNKAGPYYEAFSKHLALEHSFESIAFLDAVLQWEKTYFDVGAKTAKARARKIAKTYVGDKAELSCNLPANCVRLIEIGLEKQDADVAYDFFRLAKSEIVQMLYRDSFRRFSRSKEFKELRDQAIVVPEVKSL